MSRFRSTKYKEKVKIRRTSKGASVRPLHLNKNIPGTLPSNNQSLEYVIPFRGFTMSGSQNGHITNVSNRLARHGFSNELLNQFRSLANGYLFPFFEWSVGMAQMGEGTVGINIGDTISYNIDNYLMETNTDMRSCSGCPGYVGSCSTFCASGSMETNIGSDNWQNPKEWRIKGAKLTIHWTF